MNWDQNKELVEQILRTGMYAKLYGVKFLLYDEDRNPIGEFTSDDDGYVYITADDLPDGANTSGRFYLRELEAAEGYILDKEYKTVYVRPGRTAEIEWVNEAITGQIQIYKYAAEANSVTGVPAGTPLQGAVYEIINERSGRVVDYITTDARGVAASKPLPLTRYKIREVTAPAYFQLDPMKNLLVRLGPKAPRYYVQIMAFILIVTYMITPALAVEDMWTAANRIIVDVYNKIAGISTVLAGLMSAVAVIGAKVSNNQHKTDQAWDWLKRIWIAWAIINGMGAFLAYVRPLFDGLATIQ